MRVSLDLDDTLICLDSAVMREAGYFGWLHRWILHEPLRLGTRALVRGLRERRCTVYINTTSFRSPSTVKFRLLAHGVRVQGVITQVHHDAEVKRGRISGGPTKYPPAFGISLHIDNEDGVRIEASRYGYDAVIVKPHDEDWVEQVLRAVDHLRGART